MDCENVLSRREPQPNDARQDVPVVPLPPSDRIGSVECGHNRYRSASRLTVHVKCDASATIRCVQEIGNVNAGMRNLNGNVKPLTGFGPSNVELVLGGLNKVIWIIVDLIVELGVRGIDTFIHSKLVQVCSICGI